MIESPDLIQRLSKLLEEGSSFWGLFDRALVSRSRMIELVEMLEESLPVEVSQAMEIVEHKDDILEEARQKAGEILDEAVRKAEKLVDADNITVEARHAAKEIKRDTDRYVRERLAALEDEMTRLLSEVRAGIRSVEDTGKSPTGRNPSDFTLDM